MDHLDRQLTWTFKIHPGLKWSDGQPITAKDAAWTFNLIMHNPTAATSNGSLVANFKTVTAPDDTTLVITTKQPQANMLYVSIPVSRHPDRARAHLEEPRRRPEELHEHGLPGGRLRPVHPDRRSRPTSSPTLTANKDFFLGAPKYDKVVTNYYANSDAAAAALTQRPPRPARRPDARAVQGAVEGKTG